MRCACGHENPHGSRFCNGCGTALGPEPATPRAYTPPHLAEKILTSRTAIEGERKQVTVLFADVKGSMDLAEQVDPEEWHRILDGFFRLLAEGVHRFEGTVNQYTGDGIMALFGAPIAHEDHARRACWAALHLRDELRRYAEDLKRTRGLAFAVRMGLNSGDVVVGRIGDDLRMDYTAIGHTVGLAQRMEQLAEPGRIYLTAHTASSVAGFFQLRNLGAFTLKGSSVPLEVHELEGVGTLRTRLDLSRMRGFSRFVGREAEMATLEALLEEALAGRGRVVGVVAEAGTGKSRLCFELAERCRARGIAIYEAHGVAHGKTIPLLPVLEMMRSYFGVGERDTKEEARRKVAGTLVLLDPALTPDLPLILDFLGIAETPSPPGSVDPEVRQRALLDFSRRLIAARSRHEAALLVVEDLHWVDAGTESYISSTVEAVADTRTLVVLNFRPEYEAPWMGGAGYRQLALSPLGPEATAALLDDLLGHDPSVADLRERIRERTQGNPFFVEELVQALAEAGSLVGTRGAYRLAAREAEIVIPATVQAILAARIDRLGERDKAVLQAAAVIGREFSRAVLARVARLPDEELATALDALGAGGLVYETALYPDPEYAFRHPLTQEVAYRSQLADRRSRVHTMVAHAIIALDAERLEERAALLATHFEAAGDALEAARWHARAGLWIEVNYAAEAFRHWSRVRELVATVTETQETRLLGARACAELLKLAAIAVLEVEDPEALFRDGAALAERSGDLRVLALVHAFFAGHQGLRAGDEEARVRHGRRAVELAVRAGDRELELAALLPVFAGLLSLGRLDDVLALSERALAIPSSGPSFWGLDAHVFAYSIRVLTFAARGALIEARRENDLAFARVRQVGGEQNLGMAHGMLVLRTWYDADASAARLHSRAAVATLGRHPALVLQFMILQGVAIAHLLHGEWQAAIEVLEETLTRCRARPVGNWFIVRALSYLAEACLGAGMPAKALALAEEATAIVERHGVRDQSCLVSHLSRARALGEIEGVRARDRIEAALAHVEKIYAEMGARGHAPFVCVERARLARLLGDEAGRARHLAEAERLFTAMGAPLRAALVARELAG